MAVSDTQTKNKHKQSVCIVHVHYPQYYSEVEEKKGAQKLPPGGLLNNMQHPVTRATLSTSTGLEAVDSLR